MTGAGGRPVRGREPGEEMSCLELVTLPSAPFWARRYTRAALHAWQLWPETVDTAELLVSELVTNAICAAGVTLGQEPGRGPEEIERIALTLRLLPGRVVLEVFDCNPAPPVLTAAGSDSESGRGLMLIDVLSKEWGHFFPPSGGKVVFAVLGIPLCSHEKPVTEDSYDHDRRYT
jgi:anti-sigma regulatory factor (Ser/Thr protein kinase)